MKKAPWTPEEVTSLNGYQQSGVMHEFTCGSGGRCDASHDAQGGMLVATKNGWICPYCDYAQNWCHEWMADGTWRKMREKQNEWVLAATKELLTKEQLTKDDIQQILALGTANEFETKLLKQLHYEIQERERMRSILIMEMGVHRGSYARLEQAIPFTYPEMAECSNCQGSGHEGQEPCNRCGGTGKVKA